LGFCPGNFGEEVVTVVVKGGEMRLVSGGRIGFFTFLTSWLLAFSAASQTPGNAPPKPLPAGEIIEGVVCANDPAQSYALYLPSSYTASKTWPIIYAFDPLAYGKTPVKLYREAAEKYGFIVAGSNNSRNFSGAETNKAILAVWQDTHDRLSLDPRRIYATGFSGGARAATSMALRCAGCQIAGVIAHGAGYPASVDASQKVSFIYFVAVGDQDFNWPEIMELRRKKEEAGAAYRVRVFPGEHQWAPGAVIEEAIEWIQLKAMQSGTQARDVAFIDRLFAEVQQEVEQAEQRHDAFAELEAYQSLASDFNGLKNVSQYEEKLASLKKSPELKQALKNEQDEIAEQQSTTEDVASRIANVGDADFDQQPDIRREIVDRMTALKSQADHAKSEEKRLVLLRAFHQLWAQGIETGQARMENKLFAKADYYFRLMGDIAPSEPWPALLLAEVDTARGDKKHAIKDLREAVKRGLKNPDAIDKDTNLEALRSEAEFQQIVAELRAAREAQPPTR
jgi:dienelactone hydrolase